jgi:hypothetical protein
MDIANPVNQRVEQVAIAFLKEVFGPPVKTAQAGSGS